MNGNDAVSLPDDERRKILKERARRLAAEHSADLRGESVEVLSFILNREFYALETRFVREVYPLKNFTRVPCTPAYVAGIMNVRGGILSIINLGKFFNISGNGLSDLNKVIILQGGDMEFGILADEISGVKEIFTSDIETSLVTVTDLRDEYMKGVTADRLIILDAGKILSDSRLVVNEMV